MTLSERTKKLNDYVARGARQYEADTGNPFRIAFKQCGGKLSHVIMPSDLIRPVSDPSRTP